MPGRNQPGRCPAAPWSGTSVPSVSECVVLRPHANACIGQTTRGRSRPPARSATCSESRTKTPRRWPSTAPHCRRSGTCPTEPATLGRCRSSPAPCRGRGAVPRHPGGAALCAGRRRHSHACHGALLGALLSQPGQARGGRRAAAGAAARQRTGPREHAADGVLLGSGAGRSARGGNCRVICTPFARLHLFFYYVSYSVWWYVLPAGQSISRQTQHATACFDGSASARGGVCTNMRLAMACAQDLEWFAS